MATLKVSLTGFEQLKSRLAKASVEIKKEVNAELEVGAEMMRAGAINDAPFGKGGFLRGGIVKEGFPNGWGVFSNAFYSPYIEWGTITRVVVPAYLQDFAIQFKGRGIRKNGGIFPQPYFFKQLDRFIPEIIKNVENVLKDV